MGRATIGSGKTYATIGAFVSAEPAGTIGELFDAIFSGTLFTTKQFHFIGQIASRGVKLTSSGLTLNLAGNTKLQNLELEGTGTSIVVQMANGMWLDIDAHGDTGNAAQGAINATSGGLLVGVIGRANSTGFGINANACRLVHCVTMDNAKGFGGNSIYQYCLGGNNVGADFPGVGSGKYNVATGGTPPGFDTENTFLIADWENSTNDPRIRDAVKGTTKAFFSDAELIPGITDIDAFGNQRQTGQGYAGPHDPDPVVAAVQPGKPTMGTLVPISGQVTIPVTAVLPTDEVFARTRIDSVEPWDAENPTFSRIGSGNIVMTGLTDVRREFGIYAKEPIDDLTSDWDTDFAIVGAVVAGAPATRPLALYKVAIRDFFLNSTNLLDWIQTVDSGGSTAGRVILGYSAVSTPPDIATKGPKVFISAKSFSADNAGTAQLFVATVEIIAEIIWSMDHLDNETFSEEENFIDLLLNEACGLGLALESTLEGSIESINVEDIESDDGTEGQGRRERRTVIGFLITYPMPT